MEKGDDRYSSLFSVEDTLPSTTRASITCHLHVHVQQHNEIQAALQRHHQT